MCGDCVPDAGWARPAGWTRRRFLHGVTVAGLAGAVAASVTIDPIAVGATGSQGLAITSRDVWAGPDRAPTGPIEAEPDVRVLVVHHTVSSNTYEAAAVPGMIRSFFDFHTGADKGWPDIAYNFLVDRFGGVWEARAGSLAGPVRGSATGGNQGFDQKCAFIGNHVDERPTPAAQSSMVALLAWLADRSAIDTAPGATADFVSLGSNRHPAGTTVRTATIDGHRAMSSTACPGDAAYGLVLDMFPVAVSAVRSGTAPPRGTAPTGPEGAAPTTTPVDTVAPTTEPTATTTVPETRPSVPAADPVADRATGPDDAAGGDDGAWTVPVLGGLGVGVLGAGVALVVNRRRAVADGA